MTIHRSLAITALFALALPIMAQRVATRMTELPISTPEAVQDAVIVGPKSPSDVLHLSVSLPFGDPVGAQRFADAVSDPKNPLYRHFITPEEVGNKFGISDAYVKKVSEYLSSQGLKVTLVGKNRLSMLVDGTVAQAQKAFGVTLSNYKTIGTPSAPAETFYSYATPPALPAEIAPYVIDISGLESYTKPKSRYTTPTQVRSVYSIKPLYDAGSKGEGRSIAISNWDGFRLSNIAPFLTQFGIPAPAGGAASNVIVKAINGGSGTGTQQGEADLDIQTILGVAPLCTLYIYDGVGNQGPVPVLTLEANDNLADVVSESWGWRFGSQSTGLSCHNLHVSMTAQGMTYMAASGDDGTSVTNFPYPNYDPEVMMIGGTTLAVDANGNRSTETGWSGSGGGWFQSTDSFNVLPSWLQGPGIPTNIPFRLFPDVSLVADPNTGYVVFINSGFFVIGGTSGACPTYAGGLSVATQKLISLGVIPADGAGKKRFGRLQDLLYSYQGDSSVFFDVTSGNNGTLPNGNSSNAVAGWDMVTGWGAFNFNNFVTKVQNSTKIVSLTPSTSTIVGGSGAQVTFTATLNSIAPSGGKVVTLSSNNAAIAVPPSVTVAQGATTAQFSVSTSGVSSSTPVTITGTTGSASATATVTVTAGPHPTLLSFTPSSAVGGSTTVITGKVTLSEAAPAGGISVVLGSSDPAAASVPPTLAIAEGATTGTFTVTHNTVSDAKAPTITASAGGTSISTTVTLNTTNLVSLKLAPVGVTGGKPATGTVTIAIPAKGTDVTVALALSDPSLADCPSSVTIPVGSKIGTFTITPHPVNASTSVVVNATLGSVTRPARLTINAPTIASITTSAATVIGGTAPTITVTLTGPAGPAGVTVAMSVTPKTAGDVSSATMTIAAGNTTGTVTFNSKAVNADTIVRVYGKVGAKNMYTTVRVNAPKLLSYTLNPTTAQGGVTPVRCTVTLEGPAGPAGVVVTLVSPNPALFTVPATIRVAKNATSASFTATPTAVTGTKTVALRASYGRNVTAVLTVTK